MNVPDGAPFSEMMKNGRSSPCRVGEQKKFHTVKSPGKMSERKKEELF